MSFRRAQGRSVNRNTYLDNRLTTFTNPHIYHGDLHVERDQTIGGNLTIGKDLRGVNFYATGNYFLDNYILVPAGTINVSAAINAPNGWLICDGNVYAKASYLTLFDAIGQTYMYDVSYDQTNYFRVPDLRGRVVVGSGDNGDAGLSNRGFSEKGGAETHSLTENEIPSHTHTGTTASNGSHAHSITDAGHAHSITDPGHAHSITDPGHTHTQTTINDDYNNSGEDPPGFSADSAGVKVWSNINSSTTGISINSSTTGISINSSTTGISVQSAGSHAHTFTTGSTGGSAAHNNMQPFIALRYLIKY